MALRDQPYLPLYVQDYLTDEKLNACCAATQGVYIKIMCILHKSDDYGKLLLKQKDKQNGSKILDFANKLAKLLPFTGAEIEAALTELIDEKVMTIDGDTLFQKRMVKDGEISAKRSLAANCSNKKSSKNKDFAIANMSANEPAKDEQNPENEYENINTTTLTDTEKKNSKQKTTDPKRRFGQYSWVQLTDTQYSRLLSDLGDAELKRCITVVDEYAQSTGNKQKYKDWNLVIRKCSREGWGKGRYNDNDQGGTSNAREPTKPQLTGFVTDADYFDDI
jgi:hypothetical protein